MKKIDAITESFIARKGRKPTLIEWLGIDNLVEGIPEPLDGEALAAIPEYLQDQIKDLDPKYTSGQ